MECFIFLTAPSRISSISVTKTVENMRPALRVNWTTPQSDFTILQYIVQYKIQSSRAWGDAEILVSPPATSTVLTRLEAGTRYNVRVRAISTIGEGIWSMVERNTTYRREQFGCLGTPNVVSCIWVSYYCRHIE